MSEFVITRKRRRPRIDAEETDVQDVGPLVVPALDAQPSDITEMIPDIVVLPQSSLSSDAVEPTRLASPPVGSVVTVEKFLHRAVEKPLRTYRNKTRITANISGRSASRKKSAYMRSSGPEPHRKKVGIAPEQPKRGTTKKRKKITRLANSLSRAAVLAHGDPYESLMGAHSGSETRRPLIFEPFNKFSALSSRSPLGRNTSIENSSQFQEFASTNDTVTYSRPSTSLPKRTTCSGRFPGNYRRSRTTRKGIPHGGRIPLQFVALQEAEAAYALKFPRSTASRLRRLPVKTVEIATQNQNSTPEAIRTTPIHSATPVATDRQNLGSSDNISSPPGVLSEPLEPSSAQSFVHLSQVSRNNAQGGESASKPLKTFSSLLAAFMETARSASEHRIAPVNLGESAGNVGKSAEDLTLNISLVDGPASERCTGWLIDSSRDDKVTS